MSLSSGRLGLSLTALPMIKSGLNSFSMTSRGKLLYRPPSYSRRESTLMGLKKNGYVIDALTASPRLPSEKTICFLLYTSDATQRKGIMRLSKFPLQTVFGPENISMKPKFMGEDLIRCIDGLRICNESFTLK